MAKFTSATIANEKEKDRLKKQAIINYKKEAEKGSKEAISKLGRLYSYDIVIPDEDYKEFMEAMLCIFIKRFK